MAASLRNSSTVVVCGVWRNNAVKILNRASAFGIPSYDKVNYNM
jgi:hypothetical protein